MDGGVFAAIGFKVRAVSQLMRDGPFGTPIAADTAGRVAVGVLADGSTYVWRFTSDTLLRIATYVAGQLGGQAMAGIPGHNHRLMADGKILATVPTYFGNVDAVYEPGGGGDSHALTLAPYELLSVSGQSNVMDGGDGDTHGTVLRTIFDSHRALRWSGGWTWGDGVSSAAVYVDGDITSLTPAGQNYEFNGMGQFTPDVINFSCIATDQREANAQRVYVQMTSAEGGTPLLEYMAGTAKGDNIAGYIPGTQTTLGTVYGVDTVMYAHFLIGHEGADFTGHASYEALLSAFADEVCGYGEALTYNAANSIRPKVIAYQPNDSANATITGKAMNASAPGTLDASNNDTDVVCIGPVYHELAVDNGIHMVGKLMTGELFAHVYNIIRNGGDFTPLHMVSAVLAGDTITVTLDGPRGFVQRDADWMPTLTTDGIVFDDDTGSAAIASVAIANTNDSTRILTITLDGVPSGANPKLYVAGVNSADPYRPGGMAALYVPGPPSFWHAKGFAAITTPEIRHYICRQIVDVT